MINKSKIYTHFYQKIKFYIYLLLIILIILLGALYIYISNLQVKIQPSKVLYEDTFINKKENLYDGNIWKIESPNKYTKSLNSYQWYLTTNSLYKLKYIPQDYSDDSNNYLDDILINKRYNPKTSILELEYNNETPESAIGFVYGYKDNSNYNFIFTQTDLSKKVIEIKSFQKVNGKNTLIGNEAVKENPTSDVFHDISLQVNKDDLIFYYDGSEVMAVKNVNSQNGKVGIFSWAQTTSFINDFKIIEN